MNDIPLRTFRTHRALKPPVSAMFHVVLAAHTTQAARLQRPLFHVGSSAAQHNRLPVKPARPCPPLPLCLPLPLRRFVGYASKTPSTSSGFSSHDTLTADNCTQLHFTKTTELVLSLVVEIPVNCVLYYSNNWVQHKGFCLFIFSLKNNWRVDTVTGCRDSRQLRVVLLKQLGTKQGLLFTFFRFKNNYRVVIFIGC